MARKKAKTEKDLSNEIKYSELPLDIVALIFCFVDDFPLCLYTQKSIFSLPLLSNHIFRKMGDSLQSSFVYSNKILIPSKIEEFDYGSDTGDDTNVEEWATEYHDCTEKSVTVKSSGVEIEADEVLVTFRNYCSSINVFNFIWYTIMHSSLRPFMIDVTEQDEFFGILNQFLRLLRNRNPKLKSDFYYRYSSPTSLMPMKEILRKNWSKNYTFLVSFTPNNDSLLKPLQELNMCKSLSPSCTTYTKLELEMRLLSDYPQISAEYSTVDYIKLADDAGVFDNDMIGTFSLPKCNIFYIPEPKYLSFCTFNQGYPEILLIDSISIKALALAILFCVNNHIDVLLAAPGDLLGRMESEEIWDSLQIINSHIVDETHPFRLYLHKSMEIHTKALELLLPKVQIIYCTNFNRFFPQGMYPFW